MSLYFEKDTGRPITLLKAVTARTGSQVSGPEQTFPEMAAGFCGFNCDVNTDVRPSKLNGGAILNFLYKRKWYQIIIPHDEKESTFKYTKPLRSLKEIQDSLSR